MMLREFHLGIAKRSALGSVVVLRKMCLLNLLDIWPRQFARGSTTGSTLVPPASRDRRADDYDQRDGRNVPVTAGTPGREEGDLMACGE